MIFRIALSAICGLAVLGMSHTALALQPDAVVESEMEILHIQERSTPIRTRVPCERKNPVQIIDILGALGVKGLPPSTTASADQGTCEKVVNQITYDVTVGYEHHGVTKRKVLSSPNHPGRVGGKYPVIIEFYISNRRN